MCLRDRLKQINSLPIVIAFFAACALFYTKAVTVKMLPFDNKPGFNVVIDMPEGTALPVTALTPDLEAQPYQGLWGRRKKTFRNWV